MPHSTEARSRYWSGSNAGGLRTAEVVGLRVVDVDFMRGVVRPVQQRDGEPLKSETSRTPLPIPSELALELSAAVARWGGDYVVTDGAGRQSSTWAIERAVRAARPKIGGYRRDSASTTSGTTWHRSSLAAA
jgi:integrase